MRRGLLALLVLLAAAPAAAQVDTSARERLEREVGSYEQLLESRRRELGSIEQELGATGASLRQRIAERDRVSGELNALREQQRQLAAEIVTLEGELAATEERIDQILQNLDSLQLRIEGLLVNLHRQRGGRYARVLAQAESYHEVRVKSYYLSLLTRQDVELIRELDAAREELLEAQQTLSRQLEELAGKQADLRATEAGLERTQTQLAGLISELESTRAGQLAQQRSLLEAQEALESTLRNLNAQLAAEIQRLREEEQRLQREAAQSWLEQRERERLQREAAATRERIENLTEPLPAPSSGFVFPIATPTVVSRYGEDNNSYMALRAPQPNAPVMAVQDGVVTRVSFVSANDGYLVAVQHGSDLNTVYTNLQPPLVRTGDRVAKGEVIGHLGGGAIVPSDVLRLWVQVDQGGRSAFVDPAARLGF